MAVDTPPPPSGHLQKFWVKDYVTVGQLASLQQFMDCETPQCCLSYRLDLFKLCFNFSFGPKIIFLVDTIFFQVIK